MIRSMAAVAALALVVTACTGEDPPPPAATPSSLPAACDPDLDAALQAWADAGFSGTVALSTGGQFDCLAGYGEADRAAGTPHTVDTVFGIGSVSKAVTAAAIYRLVDDGRLHLDDEVADLLPGVRGPAATATVRQLLLHTSGLTGSLGFDHVALGHDTAVRRAADLRRAHDAGERFLYSNAGYTLLALIVQEASGTAYRTYLTSQILRVGDRTIGGFWDGEPAAPGPRAVGYLEGGPTSEMGDFAGPHWAVSGNGDVAMTSAGLAAWTHALFTGEIVSDAAAEDIAEPGIRRKNGSHATPGWVRFPEAVFGEPLVATSGGGGDVGHVVAVAWLPDSERVFVIASNTAEVTAEELLEAIVPALVEGSRVPAPRGAPADVDPDELAAAAGTYRLETGGEVRVVAHDDRIEVSAHGEDAVRAVFDEPAGVSPDLVARHEAAVAALLAGRTEEGREELRLMEKDFGRVTDVEPAGSVVLDGELRTYARVTTVTDTLMCWFALDEAGGIAGAEVLAKAPTLSFVPTGDGAFVPEDPTGTGPDVTLRVTGPRMTLTGPGGESVASAENR